MLSRPHIIMDSPARSLLLVHTFEQWRAAARLLLARGVAPEQVQWVAACNVASPTAVRALSVPVPRHLMLLLRTAACCRVPDRWNVLYRVLWRWQQGEQDLLTRRDGDGARLLAMAAAARAEAQRLHRTIRFHERREGTGAPRFVAWLEPRHDVLLPLARFYAARLSGVSWVMATPGDGVAWDGRALHALGPLLAGPAEVDDGKASWHRRSRQVFQPDRLRAELLLRGIESAPHIAPQTAPDAAPHIAPHTAPHGAPHIASHGAAQDDATPSPLPLRKRGPMQRHRDAGRIH
jgi:probable DNA metabolism protein